MQSKLLVGLLAAALLASVAIHARAAEADVAQQSPLEKELDAIMKDVRAKNRAKRNKLTAADLTKELKALDLLLWKHASETNEDVAFALKQKAWLYEEFLHDKATAEKVYAKLQHDYKDSLTVKVYEQNRDRKAESDRIQAQLAPGISFPDFDEQDLAGQPLSVGKYKGKVVLVHFWATWCPACVVELPYTYPTYKKYHGDGFEIISISLDSSRERLDAFLASHADMAWPHYFDGKGWQNKLALQYGIPHIPFNVLIGRDGKIVGKELHTTALFEAVGKALKE